MQLQVRRQVEARTSEATQRQPDEPQVVHVSNNDSGEWRWFVIGCLLLLALTLGPWLVILALFVALVTR